MHYDTLRAFDQSPRCDSLENFIVYLFGAYIYIYIYIYTHHTAADLKNRALIGESRDESARAAIKIGEYISNYVFD